MKTIETKKSSLKVKTSVKAGGFGGLTNHNRKLSA
jgi:hypothetical protein